MRSLIDFLLLLVGVENGADMYINTPGPGDVFAKTHGWFNDRRERHPVYGIIADGVNCKKCLTTWMSVGLLVVRYLSPSLFRLLTIPLAVSSLSTRADDVVGWIRQARQ